MSQGLLERAPRSLLESSGGVLAAASRSLSSWSRTIRFAAASRAFVPRDDDIYVASYPRSGTTWTQVVVHLLVSGEGAFEFEHISDVAPWWERSLAWRPQSVTEFAQRPSPRVFKTHLRPRWLPDRGRVIYLERDVQSVCSSYYRLYQDYLGYEGSLDAFVESFTRGQLQYGSHDGHVRAWADARQNRDILWLDYDAQLADPEDGVRRIAEHLNVTISPERGRKIVEMTCLDAMKREQHRFDHIGELCRQWGIRGNRFIGSGRKDAKATREAVQSLLERHRGRGGAGGNEKISAYLF